ncbi:MAG: 1-phosphofructokinase family hexose kinase [Chitinophagaceae bacterium]|nr:1-phosphofructokinase family hexose kinase [Chitinophagaceae bacterium]MBP8244481.1 1-phosphofructokinase family hexose kinase [Chitinophagaceae bacterium]HRG24957.1 1-phosphofructokinase family hexose kinase [Chitinophagaceae bacterium]
MILTVTLNPCIDKSSRVEKMKPESKLRCAEVVNEPGGGGINVSKALQKLETSSVALFPAGGHNGDMLCSLLKKEGILFHAVDTKVETRENWIVLETSTNNQYRFTFPGREVLEETVKTMVDQIRSFSPSFVVASGSLPPGLPDYFYGLIVKNAAAVGARCIVDTSGPALQALKGKHAFLIKPNIGELCKMLNVEWLDKEEVPDAAQQAIRDGFAEIMVVSMGPLGAWLINEEKRYFVEAPPVEKKSTVGAGDSMVAGITYSLQKGKTLKEAIQFGVACGSAATMNDGTQLFNKSDAERLYAQINEK